MADHIRVFAFCGSLRKGSFNRMALRAAEEHAPEGMSFDTSDIGEFPLYNEDVRQLGFPAAVENVREKIRAADAVLFVTPEYNYSLPGVLKNAIDWASRPPDQPFAAKPAAIMGASPSMLGSARAQYHLRQVCVYLNMFPVNQPEVLIAAADRKFDADGRLTDEPTRKLVAQLMKALADWTERLRAR
ncbi:MAG TPA: NAD(P)H-dependent oxidoreductase [Rhizomicrobium sp.]|jgi:chromate reductase|nr:NAD(P)H-dependent oxidoreductase [Rhizomicrobium sp.]